MNLSEGDDPSGEMVEREEAALQLLVAHQQFAKAIEPSVSNLNNPPPRFLSGMTLLGSGLLLAADQMGDVAVPLDDPQRGVTPVTCIQAQVFGAPFGRHLALDHDRRQHGLQLRNIMSMGSGHDERQGDATPVDQQVTLAPIFFPDQSGLAQPALAPAGP